MFWLIFDYFFISGITDIRAAYATPILLEVNTPIGGCVAYWPDVDEMQKTAELAKAIFMEAFSTTYTQYYLLSGSIEPIEKRIFSKSIS